MSRCARLVPNSAPLLKPAFLWIEFSRDLRDAEGLEVGTEEEMLLVLGLWSGEGEAKQMSLLYAALWEGFGAMLKPGSSRRGPGKGREAVAQTTSWGNSHSRRPEWETCIRKDFQPSTGLSPGQCAPVSRLTLLSPSSPLAQGFGSILALPLL